MKIVSSGYTVEILGGIKEEEGKYKYAGGALKFSVSCADGSDPVVSASLSYGHDNRMLHWHATEGLGSYVFANVESNAVYQLSAQIMNIKDSSATMFVLTVNISIYSGAGVITLPIALLVHC